MKYAYRYVIHAYEDARQRRPIKHKYGGTTVLTDGAEALARAEELAREFGSTSTSSTGRRASRRPGMRIRR